MSSLHIRHLLEAFLLMEAQRYDIKGRKYIGTNLKYYFTDVGIRNVRLNFRQNEPTHLLENVVFNELKARGLQVDFGEVNIVGKDAQNKSVRKKLEVDFVVNKGSQRYYIQVAYALPSREKEEQEFRSLNQIADSFKKIVIVHGSAKPKRNDEGIVVMGLKPFLLNPRSLEEC